MPSDEYLDHLAERRANFATAWSMCATAIMVLVAMIIGWPRLQTGILLVMLGLIATGSINLATRVFLGPILPQEATGLRLMRSRVVIVTLSVAAYMAGVILLLIPGVQYAWSAVVG